MERQDRERLVRILNLLGSDQAGERASAALAAHRLLAALGLHWAEIVEPPPVVERVVVKRVRDWDVNHREAAEARIRQLRDRTERQERQIKSLRSRINTLTERERRRREAASAEGDTSGG
jgi:hypothetical protein